MKKNTIMIVIDSVFYDRLVTNEYKNSAMPFLESVSQKSLSTTKMYSEAPYTEAALVSLLSGIDTLKYGGYMKKMDNKTTVMEVFKNNGYDTFFNGVQPHVYPGKAYPGITDMYYNVSFNINNIWDYRFKFYSELYKKDELRSEYYPLLANILNDNFKEWILFFERIQNQDETMSFIINWIKSDDINIQIDLLNKEFLKFKMDKNKYIKEILELGTEHDLFKIKTYNLEEPTSIEFRKKLYKKYIKTIKKINYLNFKYNLFNNILNIKKVIKERNIQLLKVYKNCIIDKDLFDKIDYNNNQKKYSPSMYSHIKHFIKWQEKRKTEKPYFAYIHIDDCHYPEIFYSYDIEDKKQLDKEFKSIENYLSKLPKKYKGSLAYDLSLLYADNCIKYLYDYLEKNNLLDKVNIAICADHGSSYTFDPMHESYVRNEYRENYNIPFILMGKDIKPKKIEKYCNSIDIPATILDAAKLKIPKEYDGKSLLKYDGNDYAILQNINGGCPDYNYRKVWLGVKDDYYSITMEFDMNQDFENGKIYSIYDMINDPTETTNLKNKENIKKALEKEINVIHTKFDELKKNIKNNNFLNNN